MGLQRRENDRHGPYVRWNIFNRLRANRYWYAWMWHVTPAQTKRAEELADHYTYIELCGASIDEEHVHTSFLRGYKAAIKDAQVLEHELIYSKGEIQGLIEGHYFQIGKEYLTKPFVDKSNARIDEALKKWRGE